MSVRPRLKSHVRPLRRSPTALQFGLVRDTGVVVEGLSDPEIDLLQHLDGSLDRGQLYAAAHEHGVPAARLDLLLDALHRHRLLVEEPTDLVDLGALSGLQEDALRCNADGLAVAYRLTGDGRQQLAARRRQFVLVDGSGGLPEALCTLLEGGGIGRVESGQARFDTVLQAMSCADDAAHRPHPRVDRRPGAHHAPDSGHRSGSAPDLVVLPATGALPPGAGAPWWRHGIPHLPLVTQGHRIVLGPLIVPGEGPCLDCLDLHRRDRDPAWPALLTQLAPPLPGPGRPVEAESTLTATAAGLAAMVAHGQLDGQHLPTGVSLEINLPWPWLTHREWVAHPACRCAA